MSATDRSKSENIDEAGPLSPGAHLRAEIERLGLDQVAVSRATGVSRQSVNNIVNGRQNISRAMAGKLGRLTGRSSDYWLSAAFARDGAHHAREPHAAGVLVNHQLIHAVKTGLIGIVPFEARHVRAASIELTSGEALQLAPGCAATARTKERIELPLDYLGRIGITGALAKSGVLATPAFQLEPGFKGKIEVCVFNAGKTPMQLRVAQPLLILEIVRLASAPAA